MQNNLDGYVRRCALELFRAGHDLDSAAIQAGNELAELKRRRGIVDEPVQSRAWAPRRTLEVDKPASDHPGRLTGWDRGQTG